MRRRWTVVEANRWYAKLKPKRGSNCLPRTAVDLTEMWQADTFDLETIGQELGWARRAEPEQPLTTGAWQDGPLYSGRMSKEMQGFSDITSFRSY